MTSYVFSVIEKEFHWNKIYEILASKYDVDFEMLLLVRKDNQYLDLLKGFEKELERFIVLEFEPTANENQMIAASIDSVNGDELVLCRDYFSYATVMSDYLVEMGQQGVQVAIFRKPKKANKFKNFFKKIYNKLIELIFGFKLYEGDIGLMYFSDIPLSVLKRVESKAVLTKVNKWLGFDMSYVEFDSLPKATPEKRTLKKYCVWSVVYALIFALGIAGIVLLAVFGKLTFIIGLLLFLWLAISGFLLLFNLLKLSIISKFGDLNE